MRVLHLFSNHKWTGPAEPALTLALALREAGVEADFACSPGPADSRNRILETARDRGLEPITGMHLGKHRHPIRSRLDARILRGLVRDRGYDLLHCHLDNDHRIAGIAARRAQAPLVRTSYYGEGLPEGRRFTRLLASAAHVFEPSERALARDAERHGMPRERASVVMPAIDTERFDPARPVPDGRKRLGIAPTAFVVGIVARMQTHRRFEDFWEAMAKLCEAMPAARVVAVGRGTMQDEVSLEPVRRLGLADRVHFPGYLEGDDYVGMVKAFDVKVFLVPGSDGTCRAAREALAMGRPAVVADRGMLREIVRDGETGFVTDGSPGGLYEALLRLGKNRTRRAAMGRAAREHALAEWRPAHQAARVMEVYARLAGGSGAAA